MQFQLWANSHIFTKCLEAQAFHFLSALEIKEKAKEKLTWRLLCLELARPIFSSYLLPPPCRTRRGRRARHRRSVDTCRHRAPGGIRPSPSALPLHPYPFPPLAGPLLPSPPPRSRRRPKPRRRSTVAAAATSVHRRRDLVQELRRGRLRPPCPRAGAGRLGSERTLPPPSSASPAQLRRAPPFCCS